MRFIKNLSIAVVSALFATATVGGPVPGDNDVLGYPPQYPDIPEHPQGSHNVSQLLGKRAFSNIGTPPSIDYQTMYSFCNTPKAPASKRDLAARAPPTGAIIVNPGGGKGATPNVGPLYSEGFGTCMGIVVLGTPGAAGGIENRFLYHITTQSDSTVQTQINNMITALNRVSLTISQIYLYTVDTRNANPEFDQQGNEGLREISEDEERVFSFVYDGLRNMGRTTRRFHPWATTGEATVPATGPPVFNPDD